MEENNQKKIEVYNKLLIDVIKKEKLEQKDLAMLRVAYSKIQKSSDQVLKITSTKMILYFLKKHPEYTNYIIDIINEYNPSKEQSTEKITQYNFSEVQEILNDVSLALSSSSINIEHIKEYINKLQSKIIEINSIKKNLSETEYTQLINALNDALLKCQETIGLYEEEQRIWSR